MRKFVSTLEDTESVSLFLNLNKQNTFYKFSYLEITKIHGQVIKNELNKLIHVSINKEENEVDNYSMHIEAFDREHLCRIFSITEKEFSAKIAQINDEVVVKINAKGEILKILNIKNIKQKAKFITEKLSENHKGIAVEETFNFLRGFYSNETLVVKDI